MNLHIPTQYKTFLLALCWYFRIQSTVASSSQGVATNSEVSSNVLDDMNSKDSEVSSNALDAMNSKIEHWLMTPASDAIPSGLVQTRQSPLFQPPEIPPVKMEKPKIPPIKMEKPKKPKVMDAINQYRAKICADMKDEHGANKFASYEACRDFMKKACNPGKDRQIDGEPGEISSKKGYCKTFFNDEEAEKQKENDSAAQDAAREAEADAIREKKAREKATRDALEKEASGGSDPPKGIANGAAPSPMPGGAPGPAGARATVGDTVVILDTKHTQEVFPDGISKEVVIKVDKHNSPPYQVEGSDAWLYEGDVLVVTKRPLADDEKWYYKNGVGRFHMDESLKLPTQGYWGKLIEHEDGQTSVGDWQSEFKPVTGSDPRRKICEQNPDNIWCQERYQGREAHTRPQRSSATSVWPRRFVLLLVFALAFASLFLLHSFCA